MNTKLLSRDFYQILDVNHSATRDEIRNAYKLAFETYKTDSLAVYSLLNEEERELILLKVKAAYEVLMDDRLRRQYDDQLVNPQAQSHTAGYVVQAQVAEVAPPAAPAVQPALAMEKVPASPAAQPQDASKAQPAVQAAKAGEATQPMPRTTPPAARLIDENRFSGTDLRSIREEMNIELQTIANMTKISIGTLRFMEENKYELLPAPIYIRGFIRQVANILHLNPEQATAAYMKSYNQFMANLKGR